VSPTVDIGLQCRHSHESNTKSLRVKVAYNNYLIHLGKTTMTNVYMPWHTLKRYLSSMYSTVIIIIIIIIIIISLPRLRPSDLFPSRTSV